MHPSLTTLYELQLADNRLATNSKRLSKLDRGEALQARIVALRGTASALAGEKTETEKAIRDLEAELAATEKRIDRTTRRLAAGDLHTDHEIESAEREIVTFKARKLELEEKILAQMERLEAIPTRARAILKDEQTLMLQFKETRSAAEEEARRLREDTASLTERRATLYNTLPPALRDRYDHMRKHHEGVAVVRIVNGGCDACRVSVSASDIKAIISGIEMVNCRSCGRYLYSCE